MLKWSSVDGNSRAMVYFKARPISAPPPAPSKITPSGTLDAVGFLSTKPALNPGGRLTVDVSGDSPTLCLSSDAYFPGDKGESQLDVPTFLARAQDNPKASTSKKPIPPSFPVALPPSRAPAGLRDCLWRKDKELPVPFQLREPDPKLRAAETSAKQGLAHRICLTALTASLKDWLTSLASSHHTMDGRDLSDTLTAMAAVAEGTCSMASFDLQDSAKAFAEARLNARQSAAKTAPDLARRGVVRSSPLSSSLFDQAEIDRVFNSVPTVIQVQQPQPQR